MSTNATAAAIDSLNFFVQAQDLPAGLLTVSATATGSNTSADVVNTLHKGALLYITIASLTVNTATLAVNINAKDALTGTYFPYIRVSLDGISATASLQYGIMIYPNAASTLVNANVSVASAPLPATFQVVASLGITTSAGQTGTLSYKIGGSKIL